ncbi:MAG: DNA repair protein RadA [Candidatus Omnitrophota bacterium]
MKTKTLFICQNCGAQSPAWLGKCPSCQNWNTLVEEVASFEAPGHHEQVFAREAPVCLLDVPSETKQRYQTTLIEFDRVVGGGVVPGSVTLIGGDPGIGKSTLSLQIACLLSQKGHKVLYVSGEESVQQTKMRADRIAINGRDNIYIVNQINLQLILEYIDKIQPEIVIIDSIQVIYHPDIASSPGSVSQVRECANILTQTAKAKTVALFIIGHVTKEGTLAGPRVLEHVVDTVLYFEGERYSTYRILRAMKNRFGSTNEIGVFEMTSGGLIEVLNPSEIFLSERAKDSSGSVVVPILEGTRPFCVEIQGLVSRANFGIARQKAQGFDVNRLALLVAVLEKKIGLNLQDKDIFLNVVGGVKIEDPAADLGVAVAVASALLDKKISSEVVVLGEVGLSSEVRSVSQIAVRLNEAQKLGFKKCIMPENNLKRKNDLKKGSLDVISVKNVKEALDRL